MSTPSAFRPTRLLKRPTVRASLVSVAVIAAVLPTTTSASAATSSAAKAKATSKVAGTTVTSTPKSIQTGDAVSVVARLAAGNSFRDSAGNVWASDSTVVSGGKVASRSTHDVANTSDDPLYQGERYGSFTYSIPVPAAGSYHVRLPEAELAFGGAGQRVFSVVAEGVTKAEKVDIVKSTGARYRAMDIEFDTTVNDGTLTLQFVSVTNFARVSSVLVTSTVPTSPTPSPTAVPSTPTPAQATTVWGNPLDGDPTAPQNGVFGPDSVWKTDITSAPVASNSSAMVDNLTAQVNAFYSGIAGFNVWQYNSSTYTVGPRQARVTLKFDDCQRKGYTPSQLFGVGGWFVDVPLPSDAVPSVGTDAAIGIYQPSTDTYWGFWKLNKQSDGWHACWGGRIDHTSQNRGWYENGGGVSATGLADGGAIGIKEAQAGHIDHAIAISIPSPADWKRFSWPALRSDGTDVSPDAIPEGSRMRLDPTINVDALPLTPLAKMVAKAAQKYGFILTDKAGCVGIGTESGAAVQAVTGVNPWNALLGTVPSYLVMRNFPWSKLQVLPQDFGKS